MTFRELYEEDFFQKYGPDSEKSDNEYLYEVKDGDFQSGAVIGMKTIPQMCKSTYKFDKGMVEEGEDKSWIKYVAPNEFFTEEFPLPYDLHIPFCC
jgi:hypothetical protein